MTQLPRSLAPTLFLLLPLVAACGAGSATNDSAGSAGASKDITAAELITPTDRASYGIGLNLGRSLGRDDVEVNQQALLQGLRDGIADIEPKISEGEMGDAMQTVQQEAGARRSAKLDESAAANRIEGPKFLEENREKEGVKVLPSGLQYRVVREGSGPKPTATDQVKVHYRGTLIDGTVFDSSYDRGEPVVFPVTQVIPGWIEALQLMPVGSKWELVLPPSLGYGMNVPPGAKFGPDAVLLFDVELLEIVG